jgi:hypothetical protein
VKSGIRRKEEEEKAECVANLKIIEKIKEQLHFSPLIMG